MISKFQSQLSSLPRRIAIPLDRMWMKHSWRLPGAPNRSELRIFALRRSGQHAIINWIRKQIPGRHCLLNECHSPGNPFLHCARSNSLTGTAWFSHNDIAWEQEIRGQWAKKGVLLYNYEDASIPEIAASAGSAQRRAWLGESQSQYDLLILRDPFNLFASRLRWAYGKTRALSLEAFPDAILLWKAYAREFLGMTGFLSNKVTINYNLWFSEREYRQRLASDLQLEFSDNGLQSVARFGPTTWGDSFDGLAYDGAAQAMKVLNRWEVYREDSFYRNLFQDPELFELSEQIFGEIPGTRQLMAAPPTPA